MAAYSVPSLLLLLLLIFQPCSSLLPPRASRSTANSKELPMVLPLKTEKLTTAAPPLLRPPNKLLFHHNVTLTVTLAVGTPPQNVSMVLDTGSELSWLPCSPASTSPPPSTYRYKSSSTYSPVPCSSPTCTSRGRDLPSPPTCDPSTHLCHVALSYADASTSEGTLAVDSFHLSPGAGGAPPTRVIFGCMDKTYSSTQSDSVSAGILGMNRGSLSFITQMNTRRFSYCISDKDNSGVLIIGGGVANTTINIPLNYTPLVQLSLPLPYFDRVAYSVQLDGIKVGYKLLPLPKSVFLPDHTGAGQTMVDSGSQFTFLLGQAYEALKMEFTAQSNRVLRPLNEPDFVFQGAFDTCFRVEKGAVPPWKELPAVSLGFAGGVEVGVGGERLLYHVAGLERGKDAVWCLTFGNSDLVPMEAYVVGHHHQQNLWVEYDLENGRVGFAPVRCDLAGQRLGIAF